MKSCPSCRAGVPDPVAVCPFCGARFPDAPPRPPEAAPSDPPPAGVQPVTLPPPRQESLLLQGQLAPSMVVMGEGSRGRGAGWWLLGLLAVAAVAAAIFFATRPKVFPIDGLEAANPDQPAFCEGATRCVVLYLAPWCAASQRTATMLDALRAAWADGGPQLEVIIGADDPVALRRMALTTRAGWLDLDDSVIAARDLNTTPTWFVLDADRRVTTQVDGTWLPLPRQLDQLGLDPTALAVAEARATP